jgi:hypothetical protein
MMVIPLQVAGEAVAPHTFDQQTSLLPLHRITPALGSSSARSEKLTMPTPLCWLFLAALAVPANGRRPCYVGPGLEYRAPSFVVPCVDNDEEVACCSLGDVCLSGNSCWNNQTSTVYQYGCTDITYNDQTCPSKCGWNTSQSSRLSCLFHY